MDDRKLAEISKKLEQIEYLMTAAFENIAADDTERASIGISLAMELLTDAREKLEDLRNVSYREKE